MVFRNKIVAKATAEHLWALLTDTGRMQEWNPNIKALIPITQGALFAGSRYRVRYRLEHTENNFLAEVLECEPLTRLSTHLTGGNFPKRGYALETYEISGHKHGTLIRQTFEIHSSSAGVFKKTFVLLRHLAGRSKGKKALKQLRAIAEKT